MFVYAGVHYNTTYTYYTTILLYTIPSLSRYLGAQFKRLVNATVAATKLNQQYPFVTLLVLSYVSHANIPKPPGFLWTIV